MKFKLNVNYSAEELKFIREHNCEVLYEMKLSKTSFSKNEIPHRMFKYGGAYIAEILDDACNKPIWAVLKKMERCISLFKLL